VQIKTGINDITYSEVLDGLTEGDEVAIGVVAAKAHPGAAFNPFAAGSKRR
jgi:hypothetical protein